MLEFCYDFVKPKYNNNNNNKKIVASIQIVL